MLWLVWVGFTAAGHVMGGSMRLPPGHPIFFAAVAVFVAIVVTMWRGRQDLLPWVAASGVSLALAKVLDGSWYIVGGAVAGAAVGVLRDRLR